MNLDKRQRLLARLQNRQNLWVCDKIVSSSSLVEFYRIEYVGICLRDDRVPTIIALKPLE